MLEQQSRINSLLRTICRVGFVEIANMMCVRKESGSRPISRVLSWAIIHLDLPSPAASSNLPESAAGHGIAFLFGLAPGGVYHAAECYHLRGALLPHHFTLTSEEAVYFLLHFP